MYHNRLNESAANTKANNVPLHMEGNRMPRLAFLIVAAALLRVAAAQTHAGQYEQADIEYGARLYSEHCITCHGERGDSMPPAKLGSGQFRHASTDRDLTTVIRDGIAGTAMAPGAYSDSELTALIAYLHNMTSVDLSATAIGDGGGRRGDRWGHSILSIHVAHF